jgi:hypothetical protein
MANRIKAGGACPNFLEALPAAQGWEPEDPVTGVPRKMSVLAAAAQPDGLPLPHASRCSKEQ